MCHLPRLFLPPHMLMRSSVPVVYYEPRLTDKSMLCRLQVTGLHNSKASISEYFNGKSISRNTAHPRSFTIQSGITKTFSLINKTDHFIPPSTLHSVYHGSYARNNSSIEWSSENYQCYHKRSFHVLYACFTWSLHSKGKLPKRFIKLKFVTKSQTARKCFQCSSNACISLLVADVMTSSYFQVRNKINNHRWHLDRRSTSTKISDYIWHLMSLTILMIGYCNPDLVVFTNPCSIPLITWSRREPDAEALPGFVNPIIGDGHVAEI